jgi:hypothetical protein
MTAVTEPKEDDMKGERQVTIVLDERQIQWVEQAVLDGDGKSALEFLCDVVKPRMDNVLNRPGCKPAFELQFGEELPAGPPDRHGGQRAI